MKLNNSSIINKRTIATMLRPGLFCIVGLSLFTLSLSAQETLPAEKPASLQLGPGEDVINQQGIDPLPYLSFHRDSSGEANLDLIRKPGTEWQKAPEKGLNFGYTTDTVWVRLALQNKSASSLHYYLELVSLIDHIHIYRPDQNGNYSEAYFSRWLNLDKREHKHRNFLFDLKLSPGQSQTVYIRFASSGSLLLPLTIWHPAAFAARDHEEQLVFGIYFGIILVMALYNLFLFLTIRNISYLYYVSYITCLGITLSSVWGFGHEYLFDWNLWLANHSIPVFANLASLSTLLFARHFLPGIQKSKGWLYTLYGLCALLVLQLGISFMGSYGLAIRTSLGLTFLSVIYVMAAAIANLIMGYRQARYFFLAFVSLLLGVIVIILRNVGILPYQFLVNYSIQIGSAMEIVLLSFALGDRYNILKEEKERVQAEALEQQRAMTESFARFVPKQFLKLLNRTEYTQVKIGDASQLHMAILFTDIRSFTTLSEGMTPADNFAFINAYLRRMAPHIRRHGGFIDKYIGDAIMALFPGGENDALHAALDMLKELNDYNQRREQEGYQALHIGIGLHAGDLMLGMIGDENRMEGTVIADAVNLAARLEGLTRNFGADIIFSEAIYENLRLEQFTERCALRSLGRVQVKGKESSTRIYQAMRLQDESLKHSIDTIPEFEKAIQAIQIKDLDTATRILTDLKRSQPQDRAIDYLLSKVKSSTS